MSEGRVHGKEGQVKVNGQNIAYITDWGMDKQIEEVDVTAMGDEERVYLQGYTSRTIDLTMALDHRIDDGQKLLKSVGTIELTLITGGGLEYRGNAIITNESIKNDKEDTTRVTVKARGTGAWTDPLSSAV
jgi:hypothetical protein